MTCNLQNNKRDLRTAYDAVTSSQTGNEWAIFEYDANSNIVKVGATGTGGIDELLNNLNNSKIQYAFGTVAGNVPVGSSKAQPKVILIHWHGEAVPAVRLAITASHLEEIRKFVGHVNLTIYARNEEDLDRETLAKQFERIQDVAPNTFSIVPKVDAKDTGISTPFIPQTPVKQWESPVPSSRQDLDCEEREKFWSQQRDEEETRRKEEAERRRQMQEQFTHEQKELTEQLHRTHLEKMTQKSQMIKSQSLDAAPQTQTGKMGKLIAGRTQMFEQKVAELACDLSKPIKKPKNFKWQVHLQSMPCGPPVNQVPEPPPKQFECILKRKETNVEQQKVTLIPTVIGGNNQLEEPQEPNVQQQMPVSPVPPTSSQSLFKNQNEKEKPIGIFSVAQTDSPPPNEPTNTQTKNKSEKENQQHISKFVSLIPLQTDESIITTVDSSHGPICAKAIWDYQAEDASELTFNPDDIISDIQIVHDGWWYGRAPDGTLGLFPSNYVQLIEKNN